MSFNFVICHQFASLIKKNVVGLFSPSFSLLRCIARCFKISNITVRDMSRWSRHRVMPHTLAQHAIVLKFSGGRRCTDILKVTGFGHERGVKKIGFMEGHLYW